MLTKLGKEKSVSLNQNFRLKYGTVDAKNLTSVYLEIQAWVQPGADNTDYNKSVSYLKNIAFNAVYNNIDRNLFRNRFIVDLDLRTSGMRVDRRSFMCLEVTLFLTEPTCFKSDLITSNVAHLFTKITDELEKNNFSFKPKKKNG